MVKKYFFALSKIDSVFFPAFVFISRIPTETFSLKISPFPYHRVNDDTIHEIVCQEGIFCGKLKLMLAKVFSGATVGLNPVPIEVEVDVASRGLPSLAIVGTKFQNLSCK